MRRIGEISLFFYVLLGAETLLYAGDKILQGETNLNRWQVEKAMEIAQEALVEEPDKAETFRLLGLSYFYKGDYGKALEYVQTACEIEPGNEEAKKLVSFVKGTKELTDDFHSYLSEHFLLRLADKDTILVDYTLGALEKAYQEIGKAFGYLPEEKVLVEIYPTSEGFTYASSLSQKQIEISGAIGICKFNRIMVISPRCLVYGYRWLDALCHEFIHYTIAKITGLNVPLWLNEGIAKYHETVWRVGELNYLLPLYRDSLYRASRQGRWISFQEMCRGMPSLGSREDVILAFAEVSWAVDYLLRYFGREKLVGFLNKLAWYTGKEGELNRGKLEEKWDEEFLQFFGIGQVEFQKILGKFLEGANLEETSGIVSDSFKLREQGEELDEVEEYVGMGARGHVRLGDIYRQRGRYDVAIIEYGKGLKNEPGNHIILNKMGKAYIALGKIENGEEFFKKSLQSNPNYAQTYNELAGLYFAQDRFQLALENYEESNQINPFNPLIHKYMGLIYWRLGEEIKAEKEWRIAQTLLPGDIEVDSWLNQMERKEP